MHLRDAENQEQGVKHVRIGSIYDIISVIPRRPEHPSMISQSSFYRCSALSQITIVETKDSGERGINHVEMILSIFGKNTGHPGIEPVSSCSQDVYATDLAAQARHITNVWILTSILSNNKTCRPVSAVSRPVRSDMSGYFL